MTWWSERMVPRVVEASCGNPMMRPLRERACTGLRGRILELGFGSGLNCEHYPRAVTDVRAVEPSDRAWAMSLERRRTTGVGVTRIGLDGAVLALPDDSVDAVLSTFTLCTIPDVAAALREVRRVLVPHGTVHLAEHGLSPHTGVARWQHRFDGLQRRVLGGCRLTRDPIALLADAGFVPTDVEQRYLPTPSVGRPWSWVTTCTAVGGVRVSSPEAT